VAVTENRGRREAHMRLWELRVGPTCRKGSGADKRLWMQLETGKAPLGSPKYSTAVDVGGCGYVCSGGWRREMHHRAQRAIPQQLVVVVTCGCACGYACSGGW
jgi:hypothetical protein